MEPVSNFQEKVGEGVLRTYSAARSTCSRTSTMHEQHSTSMIRGRKAWASSRGRHLIEVKGVLYYSTGTSEDLYRRKKELPTYPFEKYRLKLSLVCRLLRCEW